MRKTFFMLLLATGFSLSGLANESRIDLEKNTKEPEKVEIGKPTWDCWHLAIDCINGFFCANDIGTAIANAQAIARQYCPCPAEN